jgi:hypothetical protein
LRKAPVRLIAEQVENVEFALFDKLQAGDLLFVDSTHTVRVGGDVVHDGPLAARPAFSVVAVFPAAWPARLNRPDAFVLPSSIIAAARWSLVTALNFIRRGCSRGAPA